MKRCFLVLLACCLAFCFVAQPVSATSVAVALGVAAIPLTIAVASSFQALGVMSSTNSSDFITAVNNCSRWLAENSSFVINGTVSLLGLTTQGLNTSYLSRNFVQTIWEWLFDSDTVSYGPVGANSFSWSQSNVFWSLVWDSRAVPFYVEQPDGRLASYYCFGGTYASGTKYRQDSIWVDNLHPKWNNYAGAYFYSDTIFSPGEGPAFPIYSNTNDTFALVASQFGTYEVQTNHDLSLGLSQSPFYDVGTDEETIQIEVAPIYIDWTKYGVPDPNNPDVDPPYNDIPIWLPISIPSTVFDDSVLKQNQQQAQSGIVSDDIIFEPYESGNPGTGGSSSGGGSVPSFPDMTVDLREFFPFCIPFDMYDLLTLFVAEPVAPVIHWEIPSPLTNTTYDVDVDLAPWDGIAAMVRALELAAAVIGLGWLTRDKIIRG